MNNLHWLYQSWVGLTWWQMLLWGAYFIYFLVRSWAFWDETRDNGLWRGYKRLIFSYDKYFRVYHIVKIIFDIPSAIVGLFFPILRRILTFKIYEFKELKESK